jgi:hypothetical protein
VHRPTTLHGVIGAALLVAGCVAFAATPPIDDGLPGPCEGPACTRVATPVRWPDVRQFKGFSFDDVRRVVGSLEPARA